MLSFRATKGTHLQFGTLPNLDRVSFGNLPESRLLALPGRRGEMRLHFGAPVWGDKEWVGSFYPPKTKPKDFLSVYSRQLTAVELNSTFYSVPAPETIRSWHEQVPPAFKFSPKFNQALSHVLIVPPQDVLGFCNAMRDFGPNLGMSFLQLPDRISPAQYAHVERLLRLIPRDFEVAVEFRHPGWFERGQLGAPATRVLLETGRHAVITDVAGRRDVLHGTVTGGKALVRFSGYNGDPSDLPRLEQWAVRLAEWREQGVEEVYFYFHSPEPSYIPELISSFVQIANRHGFKLESWKRVPEAPAGEQIAMGF